MSNREAFKLRPWWHPQYEPDTINFDRLGLPDKARSKRVRVAEAMSYQAFRNGHDIVIKRYGYRGRVYRRMELHCDARQWPVNEFEQMRFARKLQADMALRVFGKTPENIPNDLQWQAEAIAKAIRQTLTREGENTSG